MYTRNWDNFNTIRMTGDYTTAATGYADGSLQVKNTVGTVQTESITLEQAGSVYLAGHAIAHMTWTAVTQTTSLNGSTGTIGSRICMLAGSGTDDESYDNYQITDFAGQTHVSYVYSANPVYNATTDKWSYTVTRILTNASGAAITVAEIGVVVSMYTGSANNYLLYRKKLAAPFEVANGANYSISFDFEYQAQSH